MRSFLFSLLFVFGVLNAQNILLRNVNIIPVNHEIVIPGCNVFIRDGRIEKITPYPYVKEPGRRQKKKDSTVGYIIHDCAGAYLIPGLFDMHAHLPAKDDAMKLQDYLRLQLAAGVTQVRSMRGAKEHLAIRDSVSKGIKRNSPELWVSYLLNEADSAMSADETEKTVMKAKSGGYDFIKYLGGMRKESFRSLIQACSRNDISVAGHAYNDDLSLTVTAGFRSVEHYFPFELAYTAGEAKFRMLLDTMKRRKTGVCPTLSFYDIHSFAYREEALLNRNGMLYVNPKVKKEWLKEYRDAFAGIKAKWKEELEKKYIPAVTERLTAFGKILKMMADAGVYVLLSPDECMYNVPGFSMYEEMKLYRKAGLSNYQILKCATWNAARCMQDPLLGSVEVGKKANLVLLSGNPLEDIEQVKNVSAVILQGRYIEPAELVKVQK